MKLPPPHSICLDRKRKAILLVLTLIIFAASVTFFTDFLFQGHDLGFHASRIIYLADSLKAGIVPQRIQFTANNGYGYASPLFYGELFLYVPALLYCLGLPLVTCYQVYAVLVNALTCLLSYFSFWKISGSRRLGLVGACIYTLSAYRMICLLTRAAVGEYTAMAFLPLIVYGFWYIYTRENNRRYTLRECLPIIVGLTGVIQSHLLTLYLCAGLILLTVIIFWKKTFSKYRFAALARSAVLTLLLNLWFILPMLLSMAGLNLQSIDTARYRKGRGLYIVQLFGMFMSYSGGNVNNGMQDEMPLTLGISLTLGLLLFFACILFTDKDERRSSAFQYASVFAFFTLAAVLCTTNLFQNGIVAKLSPLRVIFRVLQYPWRLLAPATVFACFMTVFSLKMVMESVPYRHMAPKIIALILIFGITSIGLYTAQFTNWAPEYGEDDLSSPDTDSNYLLVGADKKLTKDNAPLAGEGVSYGEVSYSSGSYALYCENASDDDSYIVFPVFHYDNYHAYDSDTGKELALSTGENMRVQVELPAGYAGTVLLKYEEPLSWRICEIISLLTLLSLPAGGFIAGKRKKRPSAMQAAD